MPSPLQLTWPVARGHGPVWLAVVVAFVLAGCGSGLRSTAPGDAGPIRIGAVFPLTGTAAGLAAQELAGVQAAVDFANADGGVGGRRIVLDVRDLESRAAASAVMADLRHSGDVAVVGAYSSELSIPASAAANDAGLVYWEAGAVADQLTGRGLPLVFRVGASGTNLGSNSAAFAASELAPRLGKTAATTRVAIVHANDTYAVSVADAARTTAAGAGLPIVADLAYDAALPRWVDLMRALATAAPDVIILASHIPDGVAFRQAMLAAGLHTGALIGSTMAECDPDFAGDLGSAAIGIFASDRPTGGFQPSALDAAARAVYERFATAWPVRLAALTSTVPSAKASATPTPDAPPEEYGIRGPIPEGSAAAGPTEEGLSGFAAGWALVHDVLPAAATTEGLDAAGIAAASRAIDLPVGSLPNGAGLRFSANPGTLGQNERAAAVIWQWQAVRAYTFVWPATYQTGQIDFVPLDR